MSDLTEQAAAFISDGDTEQAAELVSAHNQRIDDAERIKAIAVIASRIEYGDDTAVQGSSYFWEYATRIVLAALDRYNTDAEAVLL